MRVFGSRVTGLAKKYSDLDLAIISEKKLPVTVLYSLKEDLEQSDLPFRADILDWQAISDEFKKVINARYEPFFV